MTTSEFAAEFAAYQRARRDDARAKGLCASCCKRAPGEFKTCDVCLAKRNGPRKPRPVAKTPARPVPMRLRDNAESGCCGAVGCTKRPAEDGLSFCRAHGAEYARGLRGAA